MKLILPYLFIFACFIAGCTLKNKDQQSPPAYDLSKPEKFLMPESMLEISGIGFYKGNNDTIYAIHDEEGKIYRLAWGKKKQYHSKFGKQGDYEDVAIVRDRVFVLKSNGIIYEFPFENAVFSKQDDVKEFKDLVPSGEYESLYGDEKSGELYMLCKDCPEDKSKKFVTGFVIQMSDTPYKKSSFEINVKDIKHLAGKFKAGFMPSAFTKNPFTNEWYIVSAVNKLLVITDNSWIVKDVYPLNGNIFNHPEGIAFDKEGNLYISNEGDELSLGNILKFELRK